MKRTPIVSAVAIMLFMAVAIAAFSGCQNHTPSPANRAEAQRNHPATTQAVSPDSVKPSVTTSTHPSESQNKDKWLIVPGKQVGIITKQTTLDDLQRLYGKANAIAETIPGPEGSTLPGAWLYPNHPKQKLALIWKEDSTPRTPESIQITGTQSVWHTEDGITLGTSLKTLEQLNGGPFTLAGFDWDYGGTVLSWGDNGKLRAKYQTMGRLVLRLSPPDNAPEALRSKVSGDNTFSSSNPAMQALNPTVDSIWIMLQ